MPGTIQDIIQNQGVYEYKIPIKLKFDILPNIYIGNMINEHFCYYGTDIPNNNKTSLEYNFNSRGFRDEEWPVDLQNSIWCIGDSHTLGIGIAEQYIYSNLLKQKTKKHVINIGFYGANNIWLSCAAVDILNEVKPKNLVIGWTHFDKKVKPNEPPAHNIDSYIHFKKCVDRLYKINQTTNIIQFVTPNATLNKIDIDESNNFLGMIETIDYARDNVHMGEKTHEWLANKLGTMLC